MISPGPHAVYRIRNGARRAPDITQEQIEGRARAAPDRIPDESPEPPEGRPSAVG